MPRPLLVPGQSKPPGIGINPCFLWDASAYLLGLGGENAKPDRVRECFRAFRERHLALRSAIDDDGFAAVCTFLQSWEPDRTAEHPVLADLAGAFGVFQIRGREQFVHESDSVRAYWDEHVAVQTAATSEDESDAASGARLVGPSLVTGRSEPLARLHEPAIKGVVGAQTAGAKLTSFNCPAFESYGQSQTYNAPVGVRDAFRYCTALNYLLSGDRHRARLGDTTLVFWTDAPRAIEIFGQAISGGAQDGTVLGDIGRWAAAARRGVHTDLGDPSTPFYILGLSPNAARLSVRFWIRTTVGEVFTNLAEHAGALALDGAPEGFALPTLQQIARETVPAKSGWPDDERLPPRLVGELGRAVLLGLPYPASLFGAVVGRARTDGWVNEDKRTEGERRVGHRRACIIAACLRRGSQPSEVPMSLNESHSEPAYHLGRLFAVLDKIAEDASERRVNRRDKYFASASSNPATVFPRLLRLSTFDLKKLGAENAGYRVAHERRMQTICDRVETFPPLLDLRRQGLFCLGFYQQRQALFTPREESSEPAATAS